MPALRYGYSLVLSACQASCDEVGYITPTTPGLLKICPCIIWRVERWPAAARRLAVATMRAHKCAASEAPLCLGRAQTLHAHFGAPGL